MKFLRITWNGMPIYINVNSIGCVIGCEGGARICLAESEAYWEVKEPIEDIMQRIEATT